MNNNGTLKMIILLTLLLPVPCGLGKGGGGQVIIPTQPTLKQQYLENGKSKHSLYTNIF